MIVYDGPLPMTEAEIAEALRVYRTVAPAGMLIETQARYFWALGEIERLRGLLVPLVEGEPTFAGEVDGTPYCIYCSGWQSGPQQFPHDADCPWLIARCALKSTGQE